MTVPVPELSIVVPAYNEGKVLATNIAVLRQKLDAIGVAYEILIVDDGSLDDTLTKANQCADERVRVISYPQNRGKGYAVREGMLGAVGKYTLFMDADLATSLDEIEKFLTIMRHYKFDVVIGTRRVDPSLQERKQPFYRRFFGRGFIWLSCVVVGKRLTDFTCGFKMYKKEAAEMIFAQQKVFNWAFDTELLFLAVRNNLSIHEVPVVWRHQKDSKVRVVREIFTSLTGLMQIPCNAMRGRYR